MGIETLEGETGDGVDVSDLPTEVDWRTKDIVTDVKDQKQCGSCWAFSATGSLEGQHALKTKKLVSLSEQNLVDCSMKEGSHGCFGGLPDYAFKYVKDQGGIDTEASYPYTAKTGKKCLYNSTTVGPVSVGIDASRPTFHFYKKGVYHDKHCSNHF